MADFKVGDIVYFGFNHSRKGRIKSFFFPIHDLNTMAAEIEDLDKNKWGGSWYVHSLKSVYNLKHYLETGEGGCKELLEQFYGIKI